MSRKMNDALGEGLKSLGRAQSPEELAKRGVNRVHSLSVDMVSKLMEQAVNRTLAERALDLGPPEVANLAENARRELFGLVRHHQRLREWQDKITDTRGGLEQDASLLSMIEEQMGFSGEDLERITTEEEITLRAGFSELVAQLALDPQVEARLLNRLLERTHDHVDRVFERLQNEAKGGERQVELLQRRMEKLMRHLRETEDALQSAIRMGVSDEGMASIYRVVQGLPADEAHLHMKQELLKNIFESNLELKDLRAHAG